MSRQHYLCKKCGQVIASLIVHLEKVHDFDGHKLYEMEETDYWNYKDLIKQWFEPTNAPYKFRNTFGNFVKHKPKQAH